MRELEAQVATLTVQVASLEASIEQLFDPERGRLVLMERHVEEIWEIKQQASGALKLITVLATIATAAAAAWAWIMVHLNVSLK